MNIAVLRLPPRPDARTRDLLAAAANRHMVSQSALSVIMAPWVGTSRWADYVQYVSSSLHDALWSRFLEYSLRTATREARESIVPPELAARLAAQGTLFTPEMHWDAFFAVLPPEEAAAAAKAEAPFLPGSMSYHWHNRCASCVGDGGS